MYVEGVYGRGVVAVPGRAAVLPFVYSFSIAAFLFCSDTGAIGALPGAAGALALVPPPAGCASSHAMYASNSLMGSCGFISAAPRCKSRQTDASS